MAMSGRPRLTLSRSRCAALLVLGLALLVLILTLEGVLDRRRELSYHSFFSYPLEGDVAPLVELLQQGQRPSIPPIEPHQYRYLVEPAGLCAAGRPVSLLLLISSDPAHAERRRVIRRTWAAPRPHVRHVFVLGTRAAEPGLQRAAAREAAQFGDVVLADFEDSYDNLTRKTMSGVRWAVERCADAEHALLADDDMYVSVPNLLKLASDPDRYPAVRPDARPDPERVLLMGFLFTRPSPVRKRLNKFYMSLEEYPFDFWPPYCSGGGRLVSRATLRTLFYASLYTKLFRFEDVYIGLVAQKASIQPRHSPYMSSVGQPYSATGFQHIVTCHLFGNPLRLLDTWQEQHRLGHA